MKIVVFGAGGFVGGWLCEELAGRRDVELVPCVRNWSSAARLARRGLQVTRVDLEETTSNLTMLSEADVVVNASKPAKREPDIAVRVYSACATARVRKFIQLSSIAIYGDQTGNINEDTSPAPTNEYGRDKTEMETRLLAAASPSGPQLFILRPSIIYGPFSDNWTIRYARRIAKGRWRSLGWAGGGSCNLVHCQDVVKSIILASQTEAESRSYVMNINGPEVISWNEYIDRFGKALAVDDLKRMSPFAFSVTSLSVDCIRKTGSWVKRHGFQRVMQTVPTVKETAQSAVDLYPTPDELHLWRQKVCFSWERARNVLGFRPSITVDEGLRQSAEWCHTHGIV